ncbi:ankyrin repeat domain-containing protein 34A [Cyclopterus lumpus]|uniref:ankyrin repeat domain-containing protein 34A n=1 Tax=Cyclopterus lumpus TaxID=8103 RepID=UPI001486B913|nr:ankyrin repeat domain-containing protein 34A [Cyclopterus lumpus]
MTPDRSPWGRTSSPRPRTEEARRREGEDERMASSHFFVPRVAATSSPQKPVHMMSSREGTQDHRCLPAGGGGRSGQAMADPLSDSSPLISAAASGKLRLVRLLVEGGARVNGSDPRGETPLLAACRALRGEPAGPAPLKLLTYLLHNKADPNARDRAGRTALMYACMERAGARVASALLAAGADPSAEDDSGASALVYAINAQHRPTLKVLVDACRAGGRDIIIIATETGVSGGPVTRHYLNVPPCPASSPVSCMSPSDIVLRTGSPGSPEGENVFDFRGGASQRGGGSDRPPREPSPPPRQRVLSEPWLAIHNLARLNRTYEEGVREEADREEARRERGGGRRGDEETRSHRSGVEERREISTLPSLSVAPPPLQLPPLADRSRSGLQATAQVSKSSSMVFLPHPPGSSPPSSSARASSRPPPPLSSSATSLFAAPASCCSERGRRSRRRHSVQLEREEKSFRPPSLDNAAR